MLTLYASISACVAWGPRNNSAGSPLSRDRKKTIVTTPNSTNTAYTQRIPTYRIMFLQRGSGDRRVSRQSLRRGVEHDHAAVGIRRPADFVAEAEVVIRHEQEHPACLIVKQLERLLVQICPPGVIQRTASLQDQLIHLRIVEIRAWRLRKYTRRQDRIGIERRSGPVVESSVVELLRLYVLDVRGGLHVRNFGVDAHLLPVADKRLRQLFRVRSGRIELY